LEIEANRRAEGEGSSSEPREVREESPAIAAYHATIGCSPGRSGRTGRAWPLGWHLYLFAVALIAPLLAFGLIATNRMIAAERAAAEEQVRGMARMLSAAIDREITSLAETLQVFAGAESLREGNLAGFHRDASAAVRGTGQAILLIDRNLNQLVNTRVPYGTPLPQTGDPDTARKAFATRRPANGDLMSDQLAQRFVLTVMVPVSINGEVPYALILSPEPASLSRVLEQQYLPEGWVARVSDRNGLILARSERFHELFGKPVPSDSEGESTGHAGVITAKDREGTPVLLANSWSGVTGWRTAVWVPLVILEAPARQLRLALAALAAIAFSVSLLAAALVGRWLARPIAGAASAAAALGRGAPVDYTPCAIAEVNVVGAALAAAASARLAAETALRGREALLRSATENAAVGLVMLDCEQRYTFANPAYAKIHGLPHSAAELIGKRPADVLGAVYETQVSPRLDRAFTGERVTYELARPRAGAAALGTDHYVVVYDPHRDSEGKVVAIIVTIFDITERKAAEQALAASKQQLQFVADHTPVLIAQYDAEQRYKFVNRPYADFFGCRPADIFGRHAREVLGEQAYAGAAPYIEEALAGHRTEYDLELPNTPRGPRAVRVVYAPESDASGRVVGWVAAALDITGRKEAEAELARLGAIVESSDDAVIGITLEGRITSWNAGAARIFGYNAGEIIGQPITRIIPPELHGGEEQILARLKGGQRIEHYETTRVTKDGRRIGISLTVSPVHDKAGTVIGASKVGRDITERKRAEEHVRFLMRELSHRTKNMMAVVQAISWQTVRKSLDLKNFEERFTQRLEALARSHDLLVKRDWHGVVLEDLVRTQLEPFVESAGERLALHGPTLLLMPQAAQDLGMALHELATNASKYGALSAPTGKIEIGWTVDGGTAKAERFVMTWRESGGPMVSPPLRTGFGSTVITRTLTTTLKGQAELEYRAEGLAWQLTAPVGRLIAEFHPS
jgi:PAS domain S-box-containing protein